MNTNDMRTNENSSKKMNFQQYIEWAINEQEQQLSKKQQQDDLFQSINDNFDPNNVIWLFRGYSNEKDIQNQNQIFLDFQFLIKRIFQFFINIRKLNETKPDIDQQLESFMKSLGIVNKPKLKICYFDFQKQQTQQQLRKTLVKKVEDVYQQQVSQNQVNQNQNIKIQDCYAILNIWVKVKTMENFNFNQYIASYTTIAICLDSLNQFNFMLNYYFKEQNQCLRTTLLRQSPTKKHSQMEIESEINLLPISNQIPKQKFNLIKVISNKSNKTNLFLCENGSIIQGKIFPSLNKSPICLENMIIYQFKNIQISKYLQYNQQPFVYQGPINEIFDPHFKNENSILYSLNNKKYKGGFQDGYFSGQGREYIQNTLQYYGQYLNGYKHGNGYILEQNTQNQYLYGQIIKNELNGIYETTELIEDINNNKNFKPINKKVAYYKNKKISNEEVQHLKLVFDQNPYVMVMQDKEYTISNFQLASLKAGRWINSSIIDLYLDRYQLFLQTINKNNINNKKKNIQYINCNQFQDIFGSIILDDGEIEYNAFQDLLKERMCQINSIQRIVFYLNLDRGHFLTVIYDEGLLYLLDSLIDHRKSLFIQMNKFFRHYKIEIKNNDIWRHCNQSEQKNSYDCGIYTIYFVKQLMKFSNMPIQNLIDNEKFKIKSSQINMLRWKVYQDFKENLDLRS